MNVTTKFTTLLVIFLTLGITAVSAASISSASVDPTVTAAGSQATYTFTVEFDDMTDDSFLQDSVRIDMPEELEGFSSEDISVDDEEAGVAARDTDGDDTNDRILITKEDFSSSGTVTLDVDFDQTSPASEGTYSVDVTVDDNYGEDQSSTTVETYVDNIKPTSDASITSTESDVTNSGSWEIEAQNIDDGSEDTSSGVDNVTLQVKAPASGWTDVETNDVSSNSNSFYDYTPSDGDGVYEFRTVATDNVGNDETVSGSDASITYDTTSPEVSITSPTNTVYRQPSESFDIDYTYTESNPSKIEFTVDENTVEVTELESAEDKEKTTNFDSLPSEGTYDLSATLTDDVSQTGQDSESGVVVVDESDPDAVSDLTHEEDSANQGWDDDTNVKFTWSEASDNGPAGISYYKVEYSVNDGSWQKVDEEVSSTSYTLDSNQVSDGDTVDLRVTPVDRADNEGTSTEVTGIQVDTGTSLSGVSPPDYVNIDNQGSFTVSGDSQEQNVGSLTVTASGPDSNELASVNPSLSDGTFTTDLDLTESGLSEGVQVDISVTIQDEAGNEESVEKTATLDTSTPDISNTEATNTNRDDDLGSAETSFNIEADVSDGTGVSDVSATVTGPNDNTAEVGLEHDSGNTYSASFTPSEEFEDAADGNYDVSFTATDNAGNEEKASSAASVTVDTQAPTFDSKFDSKSGPTLSIETESNDDSVAAIGDELKVEATVSDSQGVESVTVDASPIGHSETEALNDDNGVYSIVLEVEKELTDSTTFSMDVTAEDVIQNDRTASTTEISLDNDRPEKASVSSVRRLPEGDLEVTVESFEDSGTYQVTEVDTEKSQEASSNTFTFGPYDDGTDVQFEARYKDDAGNTGAYSGVVSETADAEAPYISNAVTTSTSSIEVTLKDDVSGLDASTIEAEDFNTVNPSVTVNDISDLNADDGDSSATFTLETEEFDNGETPDVKIVSGEDSDGVSDLTGNERTSYTYDETSDAVAPQKPDGVSFDSSDDYINSEEAGSAGITVDLPSNVEGGTVHVEISDGSNIVSATTAIDSGDSTASFSPDVSGLSEGELDLEAWIVDDASDQNEGDHLENNDAATLDSTAPTFNSADVTGENKIKVLFSGDINGNTVNPDDFSVTGNTVDSTDSSDSEVILTLGSVLSTGATPEVAVNPENEATDDEIQDDAGNVVPTESLTASDGLAPEITSVTTYDVEDEVSEGETEAVEEGDGTVNGVYVDFSEPVTVTDSDRFSFKGHSVGTVESVSGDNSKVRVTLSEEIEGTDATPEITVESGAVEDSGDTPNSFSGPVTVRSTDGAAPVLLHSEVNQDLSSDSKTVVDLEFSEFVKADSDATATLAPAEGELRFDEQTGTTLQATYYNDGETAVLNTGEVYTETEGDSTEMTEPEVEAFTGVKDVERYREAGADFSNYSPGVSEGNADLVVGSDSTQGSIDYESISTAIDKAEPEDKILVKNGDYTGEEIISVDEAIKLLAKTSPNSGSKAEVGGFEVSADGATVKGFYVNTPEGVIESEEQAILVSGSNTVIEYNRVSIQGSPSPGEGVSDRNSIQGIHVWSGNGIKDVEISNNLVEDIYYDGQDGSWSKQDYGNLYGIHVQGDVQANGDKGARVVNNTLRNLESEGYLPAISVGYSESTGEVPNNVDVRYNHLENLETGSAGVEASPPAITVTKDGGGSVADTVALHSNNLPANLVVNNKDGSSTLDATNNYWGTDGIHTAGDVDASYTNLNTAVNSQGKDVVTFSRSLDPGLNMVSLPINQGTMSAGEVTTEVDEEAVWRYDSSEGQWETVEEFRPGEGYIFNMNSEDSFSVNVDHEYSLEGNVSSPGEFELASGWNLVGHYEEFDQEKDQALSSISDSYDEVYDSDLNTVSELMTGHAYWVTRSDDNAYTQ